MRNEVEAFLMGSTNIHSNKTGKDYVKINLIIEGEFVGFFQTATNGNKIRTSKAFQELEKTHVPTKCVAIVETKFTQRGVFTDLVGIA